MGCRERFPVSGKIGDVCVRLGAIGATEFKFINLKKEKKGVMMSDRLVELNDRLNKLFEFKIGDLVVHIEGYAESEEQQ